MNDFKVVKSDLDYINTILTCNHSACRNEIHYTCTVYVILVTHIFSHRLLITCMITWFKHAWVPRMSYT